MSAKPPLLTAEIVKRGLLACLGIAVVSLGFIASYAGALHEPTPHELRVAVAAQVPSAVTDQLSDSPAIEVVRVQDAAAAARSIDEREAYASVTATADGFRVITAPAASAAVASILAEQLRAALRETGNTVLVATAHDLPKADSRGITLFYVVAGWVIAGYLGATMLGLAFGNQAEGGARVGLRLATLALLGFVIGLGGTLIAKGIGDVPGPWLGLALLGSLTVAAAGATTIALQSLFGLAGTGLAILLFVVIGNPSSGGPAATELLASPWREIGQVLPVGASVTAFRNAAYFPDASLTAPVATLLLWLVVGGAVSLLLGRWATPTTEAEAELAAVAG